jgi:glycosyltransferase involved in cell wall biosynthesis
MAKADLHVHSRYTNHYNIWYLQQLGAWESYTDPEEVYRRAKQAGMDYITLTDHDQIEGSLLLKERHPEDVITGVETTAIFPEDGCRVHLLIYGLDEAQFLEIQRIRSNIYDLRSYVREQQLAYSVAHATFNLNHKLTPAHCEKLLLLFDVFETINGGRSKRSNDGIAALVSSLTPGRMEMLYSRHRIEPMSATPWIKGCTGGSDDHAGVFIGSAWTVGHGATVAEFLGNLRNRGTRGSGSASDLATLTYAAGNVLFSFTRHTQRSGSSNVGYRLYEAVRYVWMRLNNAAGRDRFSALMSGIGTGAPVTESMRRVDVLYRKAADNADLFIVSLARAFERDLRRGDVMRGIMSLWRSLPGFAGALPFVAAMRHLYNDRTMLARLHESCGIRANSRGKRILWFTDVIDGDGSVAVTVRTAGWYARMKAEKITVAAAQSTAACNGERSFSFLELETVHRFRIPRFEHLDMGVPSVLRALRKIQEFDPDEIYVSTQGPAGLLGCFAARLLGSRCIGIMHSDNVEEARRILDNEELVHLYDRYTHWFNRGYDELRVPCREYERRLIAQGIDRSRIQVYHQTVDTDLYRPYSDDRRFLDDMFSTVDGPVLVYPAHVFPESDGTLVMAIYDQIMAQRSDAQLLITGEGPQVERLKKCCGGRRTVHFSGALMPRFTARTYAAADALLFPANDDVGYQEVLKALSCGLPAVVSDRGILMELAAAAGRCCAVVSGTPLDWAAATLLVAEAGQDHSVRAACRRAVVEDFNWERTFNELRGLSDRQTSENSGIWRCSGSGNYGKESGEGQEQQTSAVTA